MLATIIYLNYFPLHELVFLKQGKLLYTGIFGKFFVYLLPFGIAYLLQYFFYENFSFIKNKWFWIILFAAPAIYALKTDYNFLKPAIREIWKADEQLFWIHVSRWLTGIFTALFPVYFIWKIKDREEMEFYGISGLKEIKPYILMIICMFPLIILASTQPDFLKMYPRAAIVSSWELQPKGIFYTIHEVFYSLDFITIEFFFRGFLILSMVKLCGKQCIVPAACFYCCIHLGKPMGEAISSFAGGLLLGIISYHTKSIWGGFIIHLGIAGLMELAGFISMRLV